MARKTPARSKVTGRFLKRGSAAPTTKRRKAGKRRRR